MSVFFGCKISLPDLTKTAQQPKISESTQEDQDWAGQGVLVGCPQLPPHLVSTNESERHLSEPIKATAPLAAQQSAPDLGRGCFWQLGCKFSGLESSHHGPLSGQEAQIWAHSSTPYGRKTKSSWNPGRGELHAELSTELPQSLGIPASRLDQIWRALRTSSRPEFVLKLLRIELLPQVCLFSLPASVLPSSPS